MLNVGVIGLGNIAQKAYLPVYSHMRHQVNWLLVNRSAEKLAQISEDYGFTPFGNDYHTLVGSKLDAVMIHLPTPLHEEVIRYFIEHNVNVYVDKPVTTDYTSTESLYALAKAHGVILTTGFNRRFVPFIQELTTIKNPGTIRVVKNEPSLQQLPRDVLYDLVIHPLDTALTISGFQEVINPHFEWETNASGALTHGYISFNIGKTLVTAGSDLLAGTDRELVTLTAPSGTRIVEDLTKLTIDKDGNRSITTMPKWQNAGEIRGFASLVSNFISAVAKERPNPVQPASSLITHQLIESFAQSIELSK